MIAYEDALKHADYSKIPPATLTGLIAYITAGLCIGGFVRACLENNFLKAVQFADKENGAALREIATFIYMEMPTNAYGSPQIVENWFRMWAENRARK